MLCLHEQLHAQYKPTEMENSDVSEVHNYILYMPKKVTCKAYEV